MKKKLNLAISTTEARKFLAANATPNWMVEAIKEAFTPEELRVKATYEEFESSIGKGKTEIFKKLLLVAHKLNNDETLEGNSPCCITVGDNGRARVIPAVSSGIVFKSYEVAEIAYGSNKRLFEAFWKCCDEKPKSPCSTPCPDGVFTDFDVCKHCSNSVK